MCNLQTLCFFTNVVIYFDDEILLFLTDFLLKYKNGKDNRSLKMRQHCKQLSSVIWILHNISNVSILMNTSFIINIYRHLSSILLSFSATAKHNITTSVILKFHTRLKTRIMLSLIYFVPLLFIGYIKCIPISSIRNVTLVPRYQWNSTTVIDHTYEECLCMSMPSFVAFN
jgi:hypothetical protein